jgi:D-alanine--poly(phosphoribitol) ligase subunit 1
MDRDNETVVGRVASVVHEQPSAPAVIVQDKRYSYAELWDQVLAWSSELRSRKAPPGTAAALVIHDPAHLPAAFLAARRADLVPLPIDGLMPAARCAAMIAAGRPSLVLSVGASLSIGEAHHSPTRLPAEAGYLVFSSGSQGAPKGIIGNERGVIHFVDWETAALGLAAGPRVAMLSSPSFDVVLRDMLLPLFTGGVLCAAPAAVRTNPASVLPWLAAQAVEVVHAVPSLSARWLAAASCPLPCVTWTLFGGEPLYAEHVLAWRAAALNASVMNVYGPSETTLARFWHVAGAEPRSGLEPVGRPVPGTILHRARISGGAVGDAFQVRLQTPDGSLGYLPGTASETDRGRLTREDGVTGFLTQDRGRLDAQQRLVVEGRLDSYVKRRGLLLDLAHMEHTAAATQGVTLACGVQIMPESTGDVVLAVEARADVSPAQLRQALRKQLGVAMPDKVIVLPNLPRLPSGKVDRQQVRRILGPASAKR